METVHNLSLHSLCCWTTVPNWSIEGITNSGGKRDGLLSLGLAGL